MRWRKYVAPVFIALLLTVFVIYPMLSVLVKSVAEDGRITLANYAAMFARLRFRRAAFGSVLLACGSASLSTLLGLIIALAAWKTTLPLRRLFAVAAVI
ncbi:MAG: hypothetical protein U9R72_13900, partial [Chloroflexota bacterium]|nr:hypothetical protein [Chloroflexota bacterium]